MFSFFFLTSTHASHVNLADERYAAIAGQVIQHVIIDVQSDSVLHTTPVVGLTNSPHRFVGGEVRSVTPDKVALIRKIRASYPQRIILGPVETFA